jgi:hypoxanthine phosphoribosyltransferase
MKPHPLVKEILITKDQINKRSEELAKEISNYYADQNVRDNTVIMIGLLKGCIPFMAKFLEYFEYNCETEYMVVSSYLGGVRTQAEPKINLDLNMSVEGEHILIVEDIIDSGATLSYVKRYLEFKGAADVKIVTLLDKPEGRKVHLAPDWFGFEVQNQFLIGFGLDYQEKLRNLPYIAIADKDKLKDWEW